MRLFYLNRRIVLGFLRLYLIAQITIHGFLKIRGRTAKIAKCAKKNKNLSELRVLRGKKYQSMDLPWGLRRAMDRHLLLRLLSSAAYPLILLFMGFPIDR